MRYRSLVFAACLSVAPFGVAPTALAGNAGSVDVHRGAPGASGKHDSAPDLAGWIRKRHGNAVKAGVQPIPKDIHKRFRHAYPAGLFDWAAFRIGGDDWIWREAARLGYGNALVLVLDNVILFRTADAARNQSLWFDAFGLAQDYRHFGLEKAVAQRRNQPIHRLGAQDGFVYPPRHSNRKHAYRIEPNNGPVAPVRSSGYPGVTVPGKITVQPKNPFRNQ